jgi:hypothetical protein
MKLNFRNFYIKIPFALILFGLYGLTSCTKIDSLPMLEIEVVNTLNEPVPGVLLGLFESQEEWSMKENPLQAWRETDVKGTARYIHLKEAIYFFHADGDSISNIGHEIKLLKPLELNENRKITITVE